MAGFEILGRLTTFEAVSSASSLVSIVALARISDAAQCWQMSRPMHCSSVLRSTRRLSSSALIKASSLVSLADTS